MSHAPPPGPPPARRDSLEVAVPDEPPPAYEAVSRDETVQAGPSRMDFSGPPPLPDRFQNLRPHSTGGYSIPGVGVGYGDPGQGAQHGGFNTPSSAPPPPGPPPPPRHPQAQHSSPTSPTSSQDASPTEHPVPGRALLHNGQLLVYPKGHYCSKCQNTGYKNGDARNPCSSDWRKYGKHYSGALAASFIAPRLGGNAGTVAATNFQRPLPSPQGGGGHQGHGGHRPQHHQQGAMGGFPGQYRPPPQQNYRPQIRPHMYGPPAGALVVQPGDPRIGGSCGGSGRETSLFLFDDGPCWQCRGVGRVF